MNSTLSRACVKHLGRGYLIPDPSLPRLSRSALSLSRYTDPSDLHTQAQSVCHLLIEVNERLDVLLDALEQPLLFAALANPGLSDPGQQLLGHLLK